MLPPRWFLSLDVRRRALMSGAIRMGSGRPASILEATGEFVLVAAISRAARTKSCLVRQRSYRYPNE